jgi:hypothetical protein
LPVWKQRIPAVQLQARIISHLDFRSNMSKFSLLSSCNRLSQGSGTWQKYRLEDDRQNFSQREGRLTFESKFNLSLY